VQTLVGNEPTEVVAGQGGLGSTGRGRQWLFDQLQIECARSLQEVYELRHRVADVGVDEQRQRRAGLRALRC